MVVIKNEDVIMGQLAAVREAAKLIEAAQATQIHVHGLATDLLPLQSLNDRGSLLSALLAARWCRSSAIAA